MGGFHGDRPNEPPRQETATRQYAQRDEYQKKGVPFHPAMITVLRLPATYESIFKGAESSKLRLPKMKLQPEQSVACAEGKAKGFLKKCTVYAEV
ncbi:hypothetical protein BN873_330008 [Candidatus Competibacter denitrificans Run_A_D11]|uniref:Uncharacterized protein n=1 Tax=Candidatus Competibacter denitrificans Run_A_D11 TaxID=1400863 RepID=W6M408_9GAMM|nr:hypothetical protein BN873_330008 [Candidatus Competibacter denitrificans Run_A_D11]